MLTPYLLFQFSSHQLIYSTNHHFSLFDRALHNVSDNNRVIFTSKNYATHNNHSHYNGQNQNSDYRTGDDYYQTNLWWIIWILRWSLKLTSDFLFSADDTSEFAESSLDVIPEAFTFSFFELFVSVVVCSEYFWNIF